MRRILFALALCFVTALCGALTLRWDAGVSWPAGTTVEACLNADCISGIVGNQQTFAAPSPGTVLNGRARAIPPAGYQCGNPLADCPPSEWATISQTLPADQSTPGRSAWILGAARMAIAFGGSTSQATLNNSEPSLTFTGPTISGSDTYLLVGVAYNVGPAGSGVTATATNGGTSMSSLGKSTYNDYVVTQVFGLKNPASAQSIVVTPSGWDSIGDFSVIAAYYTGVDQTTPVRTAATGNGSASPATVNTTNSATGDLIVQFFGINDTTAANGLTSGRVGAGQTFRAQKVNSSDEIQISLSDQAGATGTVAGTWSYVGSYGYGAVAVPLIPSGAAAATSLPPEVNNFSRYAHLLAR